VTALGRRRPVTKFALIEKRGVPLDDVIDKVTTALAKIGGADPYRGVAKSIVVEARRR